MRRLRTFLFLTAAAALVSVSVKPAAADLLCSCQLCAHSDVVCRISPTGFSIHCADYYQTYCQP